MWVTGTVCHYILLLYYSIVELEFGKYIKGRVQKKRVEWVTAHGKIPQNTVLYCSNE